MAATRPMTRAEARQLRQDAHHQLRLEDYTQRLGAWGVVLAWTEEARRVAKEQERQGNPEAVAELARLLEHFANHYRT
ncbi:hypothetical protein ACH4E8_34335 [Streptomyces sp. NPDC017979]|uniref:hypothetical protein n=1 Tax=Streptomyces sp. NPDC017979 TaxID=3365024 RepID=UPI0037AACD38